MRENSPGEERNWALIAYGLFLIAPATSGITTLVGVVLAYLRRDAARGGLYESHYRNLILIFWVWLAALLVAVAVLFAGAAGVVASLLQSWPASGLMLYHGFLTLGLLSLAMMVVLIWYYWRLIRGLIHLLDDRPI
ncbi:MAG TPA: hypothetical protein VGM68_02010 [Rhizomicrobium sp.]